MLKKLLSVLVEEEAGRVAGVLVLVLVLPPRKEARGSVDEEEEEEGAGVEAKVSVLNMSVVAETGAEKVAGDSMKLKPDCSTGWATGAVVIAEKMSSVLVAVAVLALAATVGAVVLVLAACVCVTACVLVADLNPSSNRTLAQRAATRATLVVSRAARLLPLS